MKCNSLMASLAASAALVGCSSEATSPIPKPSEGTEQSVQAATAAAAPDAVI
jgi:hypothetical protein